MVIQRFFRLVFDCAVILTAGTATRPTLAGYPVDPSTLNPPPSS